MNMQWEQEGRGRGGSDNGNGFPRAGVNRREVSLASL